MEHSNIGREVYLKELSDKILSGDKPTILPLMVSHTGYNFGDLQDLNWAEYHKEEASISTQRVWYTYTGPNSIICNGNEMSAGDNTDPIEQDDDVDEVIINSFPN
jgi:hypothetical protein